MSIRTILVICPTILVLVLPIPSYADGKTMPPNAPILIKFTDPPVVVRLWDVTDPVRINDVLNSFQKELNRLGFKGRLTSCDHVVDFVLEQESGKDSSYGASCTMDLGDFKPRLVMCNDVMIGKFTLTESGNPSSHEWYARFILENCPPGG